MRQERILESASKGPKSIKLRKKGGKNVPKSSFNQEKKKKKKKKKRKEKGKILANWKLEDVIWKRKGFMIQEEWASIQMLIQVTNEDSSNTWFLSNAYLGETL